MAVHATIPETRPPVAAGTSFMPVREPCLLVFLLGCRGTARHQSAPPGTRRRGHATGAPPDSGGIAVRGAESRAAERSLVPVPPPASSDPGRRDARIATGPATFWAESVIWISVRPGSLVLQT